MKTLNVIVLIIFLSILSVYGAEEEKESRYLPQAVLPPDAVRQLKAGQWSEAVETLKTAYETTMGDENLKYYIAYCYEQMAVQAFNGKKYQEAIERLGDAVHYVDDNPELHSALGMCYYLLSQYSQAEDSFNEAIRLKPDHFNAHKQLGEIYYLNNENYKAQTHWQEALRLKPEDKHVKKRLKQLKKLLEASRDFDREIGTSFLLTFNGKELPGLREETMKTLEGIYQHIHQQLNLYPERQISVVLLANQEFYNITESPDWAGGVYEGQIKIPVSNYNPVSGSTDPDILKIVLCHEYIHAVIFDRLSMRCPWWLNEGLAQYFSGDDAGNQKKLALAAELIKQGHVPPLTGLPGSLFKNEKGVIIAYALALSAVDYFIKSQSIYDLQAILDLMSEGKGVSTAMKEITAFSLKEFEANWTQKGN